MSIITRPFISEYKTISNVLINEVFISQAFTPQKSILSLKNIDCKKYNAIWDTGATGSVITSKVVKECSLKPIGITEMLTVGGKKNTNAYLVNIWLPNKVVVPNLRVNEGELVGTSEVLIGMDIINRGDFAVTNKDGITAFTYRFPSVERIDFVKNPYKEKPVRVNKIGRNDPCPCGSGKKYKKCCGK